MKKLTGKCKDDFMKQFCGKFPIDNVLQNTYIIEFFDSVGIYIEVKKSHSIYWIYDITIEDSRLPILALISMQESRQEATEKAIEKANFIYNDRV